MIKKSGSIGVSHVCGSLLWVTCVLVISANYTKKSTDRSSQIIVKFQHIKAQLCSHNNNRVHILSNIQHTASPPGDFWKPQTNKGKSTIS